MLRWMAPFALSCMATQAFAQDFIYSSDATENCLARGAKDGVVYPCFGASANACMAASRNGGSTQGMVRCLEAEVLDWDRRLNTAYKLLMTYSKAVDAEMTESGSSALSQAEALRTMQRAWIPFRDASCEYERSTWGGGTGGGPDGLTCFLNLTATQAWSLEQKVRAYTDKNCNHRGCAD